jgi:hypothetical protein
VAASNGGGASGFSNVAEAATLPSLVLAVTPTTPVGVAAGTPANYTVVVQDGAGAPVEGASAVMNVTGPGFVGGQPLPVLTNAAGVASFSLTAAIPGVSTLVFSATKTGYLAGPTVVRSVAVAAGP